MMAMADFFNFDLNPVNWQRREPLTFPPNSEPSPLSTPDSFAWSLTGSDDLRDSFEVNTLHNNYPSYDNPFELKFF